MDHIKPSLLNRMKRRDKRLSEELIECRRWGGGRGNKKYRDKGHRRRTQRAVMQDSLPAQESIRGKRNGTFQDDNLEPLIRFLQSHCGQPWNQVYSKLKKQLDDRSVTGLHVIQHLWDFVYVNTRIENGELVYYSQYGGRSRSSGNRWFYVHPLTGILHSNRYEKQKGPFPKKARWKKQKEKAKIKRKLGIVEKPQTQFIIPQVQTYEHNIHINRVYDLVIKNTDGSYPPYRCKACVGGVCNPEKEKELEEKFICRVQIVKVEKGIYGLQLKVKVLKSHLNKFGQGQVINLYENRLSKTSRYTRWAGDYREWKLLDVGTFEINRKEDIKPSA